MRRSRLLVALLLLMHLLAAAALNLVVLPLPVKLSLTGLLLMSLSIALYRLRNPAVVALHPDITGNLEVETKVGARKTAAIGAHAIIFSGLIVLRLRCGEEKFAVSLLPDSLDADHARQLRLWLRWRPESQINVLA